MLSIEEIQTIIGDIVKIRKDYEQQKKSGTHKGHEYPEYYHGYNELCSHYDAICVHSETGKFPDKLFSKRSPNMQEEEFQYIKETYQQTTLPVFIDYTNLLKLSFNDGNWSIHYGTSETDKDFEEYVEKEFPVYGSFEQFAKEVLPEIKSRDAMGMIAIKPKEIPIVKDAEGNAVLSEEGAYQVDDSELISPMLSYFTIKQLMRFKEHEWYVYISKNKSMVEYGGKLCKDGLIFEVYDEKNIYLVKQVGKQVENNFVVQIYYPHNLGYVPARRLKGVPVVREDEIGYQSKFLYAVPNLNLALVNSTRLDMINNNSTFPVRVMIGNDCEFTEGDYACKNGTIAWFDGNQQRTKTCPACNGSGLRTRISPLGTIILRPANRDNPNGEINTDAAFKYVSPDINSAKLLMEIVADNENRARSILHLYTTNTKAQPTSNDTAIGQQIDEKAKYGFVKPESDQMFQLWEWSYKAIGEMRYGEKFTPPSFTYPVTFEFLTEQDYIAQIKSAMDAGMPPSVIYPLIYRFLSTLFYTEPETNKAFLLIMENDRLLTQSDVQIATGLINNTVQKWEKILHDSAFFFIKELAIEDPKFFEKELKDQRQILIDRAKEKALEISPVSAADDAVAALGGGGALDVEAEAKAKLKGTVGGVEGIIGINAAVQAGTMSEASAELLLVEIYGFAPDVAKRLIEAPDESQLKKIAEQTKALNANSGAAT